MNTLFALFVEVELDLISECKRDPGDRTMVRARPEHAAAVRRAVEQNVSVITNVIRRGSLMTR